MGVKISNFTFAEIPRNHTGPIKMHFSKTP